MAVGGQLTYYSVDARLHSLYGSGPMGGEVFLRIYPGFM
ncbi:hypothetical protein MuYL_2239 [Mucilaginibacter xinganensis]|uniref:Uncharacterized protein n=1 Tax=Mucilaginibacter xinganensis TaxID=1234841 RepID=A0A223NW58_9SPHI|nr:hypothetical protein MuYL_2239 [Mucilaginibacter xinganensis]